MTIDELGPEHLRQASEVVAVTGANGARETLLVWSAGPRGEDAAQDHASKTTLCVQVATLAAHDLRLLIDRIAWIGGAAGIADII